MHNFICRYRYYLIAVLVILISALIICTIILHEGHKNISKNTIENLAAYQENNSDKYSFPDGFIYTLNNNKLEKVPITKDILISTFGYSVKLAALLDGTANIDIDSNDVKYFVDKKKKIPFYRVKNMFFSTREELINFTNSFFSKETTSELCNNYCSNDITNDSLYTFTDFDNKLYVLNGHLVNSFEFDYAGYEKADKSYAFVTQDKDNITVKLNISFSAINPSDNKINRYHTSYKYKYIKNSENIWLLSDYYSPIAVCNDTVYNNNIE